ncbi:MAG TPA: FAD/NAD(P)-binding oxidoreductase [Conexivisphaerales archaeon]|nr:FAD/NAD(P)-binding oxidoreductase [Conexivisphaerales archaeon]
MQRVVIVGSGTGGTLSANLLAKALKSGIRKGEATVELVGAGLRHPFQPANLDIAFKGASPEGLDRAEEGLLVEGVRFVADAADRIDLRGKKVTTRSGAEFPYDYLVIATGAVADPGKLPGLKEGSLNFHTGPEDSRRIWEALQDFNGGKVVVAIAGTPHKCPPSPNEAAFMMDELFRKKGIRDRTDIKFLTPYPRAYPAEKLSKVVAPLFEERGIEVVPFFNVDSVDPAQRKIYSLEGESYDYDLLVAVPPHHGADVILNSGIGDQDGWIPTDKDTMRIKGFDEAYAIGDATDIPVSKSGVVAHLQSVVVAKNILASMRKSPELLRYNGRINCPMEVGHRKAIFVSATYTSPPEDQTPSTVKYLMKKSFGKLYWRALNGSLEPIFDVFFGQTRFPVVAEKQPKEAVAVVKAT